MPVMLIVDDSTTIRKMIMAALSPLKLSFSEASSGLEAIEQLSLRQVDAVTLDLNMPDMHGLEFLEFVRSQASFEKIPILVVTTRGDLESRNAAFAAGANRFLSKPFRPPELVDEVKALLNDV